MCYNRHHDAGRRPTVATLPPTLAEIYGDRPERAILYGSRARGDPREDSDYDVAVFLHDMPDRWSELDRLADLGTRILYESGEVINALPYPAGFYNDPPHAADVRDPHRGR